MAACYGHMEIARLLLEHGADPNRGRQNFTPLHQASMHGHIDMVRLLLENNANKIKRESLDDRSPLDVAHDYGHTNIARLLGG